VESPALKPLDVIVTDITGPITPSVAPRKAYLQIAQDRATNLLAAIPLAARTDIPVALHNLIAYWQLTRGTITKRLHTDNAKEQISAASRTYLHAQGTSTTTTSPHSSAQNGAAERAILAVITHIRCNILAAGLPETCGRMLPSMPSTNSTPPLNMHQTTPAWDPSRLTNRFMAFSRQRNTSSHLANADTSCTPDVQPRQDLISNAIPHGAPNIPCRRCRGEPTNRVPRCSRSLPTSRCRPVMPTNHATAPAL
jgi:hypothetical protein